MSHYQNFNSTGSNTNYSSTSSQSEKISKCQTDLQEIYANIIHNRQSLYNIVGLNKLFLSQNILTTLANDMGIIQRQLDFISQRKNKYIIIHLKDQLSMHYNNILELKQNFLKRMNFIRKNNIVTPDIVKCAITIEKYFDIKNETDHQDEEDFDRLDIPYELEF